MSVSAQQLVSRAKDPFARNVSSTGSSGIRAVTDAWHIDRAVVQRILNGDEAAFRQLFDSYYPRLYRFALARLDGDRDAAAEVAQQTFCNAVDALDRYRGEAALYTWFCGICRNVLIDHCRRTRRSLRTSIPLDDDMAVRGIIEALTAPAATQPDVAAWRRDVGRLVESTVDCLPDHYASVLEWKYVDGLPVAEIASRLGVGTKAAESLLTRARTAFREAILSVAAATDVLEPPSTGQAR
jgi:RNA polymerase sigma-70 factor (ECF subfamily)